MDKAKLDLITERIIGAVHTVSNTLGIGFVEKVYENAHAHEIRKDGLTLKEIKQGDSSGVDLTEADIIIAGGRGMENSKNFSVIFKCAEKMRAAVGASRVAVDEGWVPYAMQVGQTGKTVSPKVYIACGISGSVQHFAGMKSSAMIIAINKDAGAAIMKRCDYFVAADLFEILPALTARLKGATNGEVR